jgi:hypothetical protein
VPQEQPEEVVKLIRAFLEHIWMERGTFEVYEITHSAHSSFDGYKS